MGKKGKPEVGTEVGKSVKKNPTQIWPYFIYNNKEIGLSEHRV